MTCTYVHTEHTYTAAVEYTNVPSHCTRFIKLFCELQISIKSSVNDKIFIGILYAHLFLDPKI